MSRVSAKIVHVDGELAVARTTSSDIPVVLVLRSKTDGFCDMFPSDFRRALRRGTRIGVGLKKVGGRLRPVGVVAAPKRTA